jgi:biopolymer transport protein ExbB/TolQ
MFVIAMIIIVGKAIYLARVQSANRKFLQDFEQLGENLSGLDTEAFSGARTAPTAAAAPVAPSAAAAVDLAAAQARVASAVARAAPAVARAAPAAAKEAAVRVAEDVTEEDRPRYTMSTVYPLYHRGISELTDRLHAQVASGKSGKTLTPQSIQAIRATMDASQVRLTQRLSAQMVLLTIAISGGPFLGLLGTVVGVMITFAAIAASGDVNVNSIAPGIAAALAATVAGLAVAIPALFGYNWLNTQIKNVNAEMRVFVDEFVTRIAEKYS